QSKPFAASTDTTSTSPLPYLEVANFQISNVNLNYESEPDKLQAQLKLGKLVIELPEADLERQSIGLGKILLHDSDIQYSTSSISGEKVIDTTNTKSITFEWPDWKVKVEDIDFLKNNIEYQQGKIMDTVGILNPNHLKLQNFILSAEDLSLDQK